MIDSNSSVGTMSRFPISKSMLLYVFEFSGNWTLQRGKWVTSCKELSRPQSSDRELARSKLIAKLPPIRAEELVWMV